MKKLFHLSGIIFLLTLGACGSIKVSPRACKSDGLWGAPLLEKERLVEEYYTQSYYVWTADEEIRLKDFLQARGINCNEVKRVWIELESQFLVKRKLTVHVQK